MFPNINANICEWYYPTMFTSQFFGLKTTATPQPFSGGTGKWNSWRATLSWFVARSGGWFSTDELLTLIVQICSFHCRDLKVYSQDLFYHVLVCFYVMLGCCQACMCKQGYERHGMNFWNAIALLQTNGDGDPKNQGPPKGKELLLERIIQNVCCCCLPIFRELQLIWWVSNISLVVIDRFPAKHSGFP